MDKLKCLELYSGIGGMHFSLEKAFSENGGKLANYSGFEVIAAIDINTVANAVYQENFGLKVLNRQIQVSWEGSPHDSKTDPGIQTITRSRLHNRSSERSSSFPIGFSRCP